MKLWLNLDFSLLSFFIQEQDDRQLMLFDFLPFLFPFQSFDSVQKIEEDFEREKERERES